MKPETGFMPWKKGLWQKWLDFFGIFSKMGFPN